MRSARALRRPLGPGSHFVRCQMCGNSRYHGKPPSQQQIHITPKKEESLITQHTLFHEKQNSWGKDNIPFHSPIASQCLRYKFTKSMACLSFKTETLVSDREVHRESLKTLEISALGEGRWGRDRPIRSPNWSFSPMGCNIALPDPMLLAPEKALCALAFTNTHVGFCCPHSILRKQ